MHERVHLTSYAYTSRAPTPRLPPTGNALLLTTSLTKSARHATVFSDELTPRRVSDASLSLEKGDMMLAEVKTRLLTPEEYLAMERQEVNKHEYFQGEIALMPGASREHNLIVASILARLYMQLLKQPCEVYPSDMRVKVSASGLYTYPALTVVWGEPTFEDAKVDTLLNPTVIIEVLSAFTEGYDRGKKFAHYRRLDSLQDYLLVAQDQMHVEHYARQPDGAWRFLEAEQAEAMIKLTSIDCTLQLEEIYEKIKFTAQS